MVYALCRLIRGKCEFSIRYCFVASVLGRADLLEMSEAPIYAVMTRIILCSLVV